MEVRLLLAQIRDGNGEIYVMNADGSNQINLTNNPAVDEDPDWSGVIPTVEGKIAFQSDRDGNNEIYVMNADGSNQINLTNNPADDREPDWSPKEHVVYVVGYKHNGTNLDWWLKKFSADGVEDTVNWNKVFDSGTGDDLARGVAVSQDGTAVYVVGYKHNGTDKDWWLKKFSANGVEDTVNWNKVFDSGTGDEAASSVAVH